MSTPIVGLNLGQSLTLYASAARTATPTAYDQDGTRCEYIHVIIDCTVKGGAAPSVVFTVQGKDRVSGQYYTILVSAAIVAVGTTVLRIGPAFTAAANTVANDMIPAIWRVIATHGNADSITYTCGANLS